MTLWLWMSGKRNVSVCRGHELTNALYITFEFAIAAMKTDSQNDVFAYTRDKIARPLRLHLRKSSWCKETWYTNNKSSPTWPCFLTAGPNYPKFIYLIIKFIIRSHNRQMSANVLKRIHWILVSGSLTHAMWYRHPPVKCMWNPLKLTSTFFSCPWAKDSYYVDVG